MKDKKMFHIHTYRCQHASTEPDKYYIEKAIELGANEITFTDHSPFPQNPFYNRMLFEQLDEYITTLNEYKSSYKNKINIKIGLEIEFLPSYMDFYKQLRDMQVFDVLMIGQHFSEYEKGQYSFSKKAEYLKNTEYIDCGLAIIDGIKTGLFNVVAHPDRIFRRQEIWTPEMESLSKRIINTAQIYNVLLEQNESSKKNDNQYWEEFWVLIPDDKMIIKGLDAHSVRELKLL